MIELRLRDGVDASAASKELQSLVVQGENVVPSSGTPDILYIQRLQQNYLSWADTAEKVLRNLFVSPAAWEPIHDSSRWAEIRRFERTSPRPGELVAAEVRAQCDRFKEMIEELKASVMLFKLPDGWIAVIPDTNYFLHYNFFKDVDWLRYAREVFPEAKGIRLVVPSVVLDELDEQSYRSKPRSDRAKSVQRALRELLRETTSPETPMPVRDQVEIQLMVGRMGHESRQNADDEILRSAEQLASVVGNRVCVATGDLGMETRAATRGLRTLVLPDEERLPTGGEGPE